MITYAERRKWFYGDFDDELSRKIEEFAEEYENRTDSYDILVCSGRTDRGTSVPVTGRELGMSSHNARIIQQEIMDRAQTYGIAWQQIVNRLRDRR